MMFHWEGCSSRCFSSSLHGAGIDNHTHQDTLLTSALIYVIHTYYTWLFQETKSIQVCLILVTSPWQCSTLNGKVYWLGQNSNQSMPMVIDYIGDVTRTLPCWSPEFQCECPLDTSDLSQVESCHRHGALRYSTHMCIWPSVHQRLYVLCIVYIKDCTHCDAMCTRDGGSHWQWHWPPEYQECDGSLAFF